MKKRVTVPKPSQVHDNYGNMTIMKDCEPLEDHADVSSDGFMGLSWLHDYDPKQDIIFTWSVEGTQL